MPVNIGDSVQASDYNTLFGLINEWFNDGCAACSFGDPTQRFGWGGSAITTVLVGDDILASDYNAMVDRVNIAENIVDAAISSLSRVTADVDDILASHYNDVETEEATIRANKNNILVAETSIHIGTSDQRTTSWSGTINSVIRFEFTDFDEARYFFNSGGSFKLSLTLVGGTTGNASNWTTLFSNIGTVTFNLDETVTSGSGTPTAVGYYDLTTGYQTIFTATGTGAYTDNDLTIEALRDAAGSYVDIRVTLADDHTGTVDGTTTFTAQYQKLDDQSSGAATLTITSPNASVQDTFE